MGEVDVNIARRSIFIDDNNEWSASGRVSSESSNVNGTNSVFAIPSFVRRVGVEGGSFGNGLSKNYISGSVSAWVEVVNIIVDFTDEMSSLVDLNVRNAWGLDGEGGRFAVFRQAVGGESRSNGLNAAVDGVGSVCGISIDADL